MISSSIGEIVPHSSGCLTTAPLSGQQAPSTRTAPFENRCTIEDGCLIGMGAIVLSHAVIGEGSVIGAGAVVREGTEVPPGSLVVGVPGRVIREVDDELRARTRMTVDHYLALSVAHRDGRWGRGAGG